MLRSTGIDLVITDPVAVGKDNTIDKIGDSEVDGAKVDTKIAKSKNQDKSKGKNLVKSFLAKFQALVQSFGSDFLTPGAIQVFTKLRQAFIKVSILNHFDPDCHI